MVNNKFWEYSITDLFSIIISGISLIISGVTLFIAYKIFKNFDAKKTHINKQMETVFDLIEAINKTIISVSYKTKIPDFVKERAGYINSYKTTVEQWPYSLFIISELNNSKNKFDNVFLTGGGEVINVLPFLKFINNPLLPISISKKLHAFYSPFRNFCHFDKASEKYVVLFDDHKDEMFGYPDFIPAFKDWDSFINCAKELKLELQKWLKKYGADDINFNHTVQLPGIK